MVRLSAARGVEVGFNSNATLLDCGRAGRLIDAGLGWLCVSLGGATAATYEDVRHGTTYSPRREQFERVGSAIGCWATTRRRSAAPARFTAPVLTG
jgi:hypothetical protein